MPQGVPGCCRGEGADGLPAEGGQHAQFWWVGLPHWIY